MSPKISILIPVKNEIKGGIEKCLQGIFSQKTKHEFEVIAIDSGSTDGTLDVFSAYPQIKLIRIKPEEFGHGKTRNLAARSASGEYLVYLNGDAWPVDEKWLDTMMNGFSLSDNVAAVYGKLVPKPGCHLYLVKNINKTFHKDRVIEDSSFILSGSLKKYKGYAYFSTVSCAIRKDVFDKIPFDDEISFGEDQDWGLKALQDGFKLVYEPDSAVYHSHNYSLRELYKINNTSSKVLHKRIVGERLNILEVIVLIIIRSIVSICSDIVYILFRRDVGVATKMREIIISIISRPVMLFAGYFGRL